MKEIGLLIVSMDEPQLGKCLEAVKNQTVPFSNITHINNVIPENEASNKGLSMVKDEWVMKIDGDVILYNNAVEIALNVIPDKPDPNVYAYNFPAYDLFLKGILRGIGVMNVPICRKVPYPNFLGDDVWFGQRLRRMGFVMIKYPDVIANHFENATEFQVFSRFYAHGVKHGNRYKMSIVLKQMHEETKDPIYDCGARAVEFGARTRNYPTSHNIDFDRKMFEEFNDNHHLALV